MKAHRFRLYTVRKNQHWKGHPGYDPSPAESHQSEYESDDSIDIAYDNMRAKFYNLIQQDDMWAIAKYYDGYWQNIDWGERKPKSCAII